MKTEMFVLSPCYLIYLFFMFYLRFSLFIFPFLYFCPLLNWSHLICYTFSILCFGSYASHFYSIPFLFEAEKATCRELGYLDAPVSPHQWKWTRPINQNAASVFMAQETFQAEAKTTEMKKSGISVIHAESVCGNCQRHVRGRAGGTGHACRLCFKAPLPHPPSEHVRTPSSPPIYAPCAR